MQSALRLVIGLGNPGLEYDGVEKDFTDGEYGPQLVNDFALDFIGRQIPVDAAHKHPMTLKIPLRFWDSGLRATLLKNGKPDQSKSFGIERVYVNGKLVLNGDKLDEAAFRTAGRALRA